MFNEPLFSYFGFITSEIAKKDTYIYPKIIKQSEVCTSLIIEPRQLNNLEFTIKNTISKLPDDWSHTIICSSKNYNECCRIAYSIDKYISVRKLLSDDFSHNDYNELLLSLDFYRTFKSKMLFIYQTDSVLLRKFDDDFLNQVYNYSWLGSPFDYNIHFSKSIKDKYQIEELPNQGNGGIGFRNIEWCKQVLIKPELQKYKRQFTNTFKKCPEDLFFSICAQIDNTYAPIGLSRTFGYKDRLYREPMYQWELDSSPYVSHRSYYFFNTSKELKVFLEKQLLGVESIKYPTIEIEPFRQKNIRLRQCYYEEYQISFLDKDCISYNAIGLKPDEMESKHILDLVNLKDHVNSDYWGFTSWRMNEKTSLKYKDIVDFINNDSNESDVYLYYDFGSDDDFRFNKISDIGLIIDRLYEIKVIPFENNNREWIRIFCNYWIAKPNIVDEYTETFLKPVLKAFETDDYIKNIVENRPFLHRGVNYKLTPFVMEYVFGLFLLHNPNISYNRIPNNHTLKGIYEKNKEIHKDSGGGDKGTVHNYIPYYEELLRPYKYLHLNILEIGVYRGESIKMWKEYFPNSNIYGIDIDLSNVENTDNLFICDINDKERFNELFKGIKFDIIIDDGSHILEDQITALNNLYNDYLNENGLFIIEDIQNPENHIFAIEKAFEKPHYIFDIREDKGRYDDVLLIWHKTKQ